MANSCLPTDLRKVWHLPKTVISMLDHSFQSCHQLPCPTGVERARARARVILLEGISCKWHSPFLQHNHNQAHQDTFEILHYPRAGLGSLQGPYPNLEECQKCAGIDMKQARKAHQLRGFDSGRAKCSSLGVSRGGTSSRLRVFQETLRNVFFC